MPRFHARLLLSLDGGLSEVPRPLQEPDGLPRRSARPPGDRRAGLGVDQGRKPRRSALHDGSNLGLAVKLKPLLELEAGSERLCERRERGRRPHQGERQKDDPERARAGPLGLSQDHIHDAVLERAVKALLAEHGKAMDLVNKEQIPVLEPGEEANELGRLGDEGTHGRVEARSHLRGESAGQGGLSEPGGAAQEDMAEGLAAVPCGLGRKRKVLDHPALADDIGQPRRTNGGSRSFPGLRP